jgi:hypothetical protein
MGRLKISRDHAEDEDQDSHVQVLRLRCWIRAHHVRAVLGRTMSHEQDREVERVCAEYNEARKHEVVAALNLLGFGTRCGCPTMSGVGCHQEFDSLEVHKLTRCLDCGYWFHPHCARKHFSNSGSEKDKRIFELERVYEAARVALAHRRSSGYFTAAGQAEQSRLDIAVDRAVDAVAIAEPSPTLTKGSIL